MKTLKEQFLINQIPLRDQIIYLLKEKQIPNIGYLRTEQIAELLGISRPYVQILYKQVTNKIKKK